MSFSWLMIFILLTGGVVLGWPELRALLRRWRRRQRWVGALELKVGAVKVYEDERDHDRLERLLLNSGGLLKAVEAYHRRVKSTLEIDLPKRDARLSHIAQLIAESLARGQRAPSPSITRTLSAHFGTSAPIPLIAHQRQHRLEEFSSFLVSYDELLKRASSLRPPQLAFGLAEHQIGDETICVGLLQPRYLSVNPFTLQIVGDMGLIIHGETLEMMPLEAWVTQADGQASELALKRNGAYFSLQLKPRARGIYQVEIIGESPVGPVVCLNASIYRSVHPPTELILTESRTPSRTKWINRARLHQLINESRELVKSRALPRSKTLDKIAQTYAQEMADQEFVSHTSPRGQRLNDRASSLQDQAERILENLASGASVEEVHDQLMSSPTHRAAVLDQDVTHLGIGVSVSQGIVYGVEIFSRMNRPLRVVEDRAELSRLVQRSRREEGLVRLPHETTLERVAQQIANALVNGECHPPEVTQHAHHILSRTSGSASAGSNYDQGTFIEPHIEVYTYQVTRVDRLPPQETWLQAQVKSFGIGLAQGKVNEPYRVVFILRLQGSPHRLSQRAQATSVASHHLLSQHQPSRTITRDPSHKTESDS